MSNAEEDGDNIEFTNNETNDELNHPISENEILQAIRSLKTNKAPGLDGVIGHWLDTFYLPPGGISKTIFFLKPNVLRAFCNVLAL